MDPEPESLEAMKTKIKNMMQCVELVRLAVVKVGISNSIDIPRVRFSLDGHNEEHELKEILKRLLSQYKDLVNHVLSYHLEVSNFSFMWPESEVEVDVMDTIAKCLLRICDQRGVGLVAAPPNAGVAAPPKDGVAAPPKDGVAAPPIAGVGVRRSSDAGDLRSSDDGDLRSSDAVVGRSRDAGVRRSRDAGVRRSSDAGVRRSSDAGDLRSSDAGVGRSRNAGVASPPNAGVAAPPNAGVSAPPNAGVAAPPNASVAAPPGGFISWLTARGDRFTGVVDSLMVLMVLCCFAWTFGKAVGVLCFGFILGTLITREIKRI